MEWTRRGLEGRGFGGFVPFSALPATGVPNVAGVYVVVRPSDSPPVFLPRSPAGHFRGRDPSVGLDRLHHAWVDGAGVLYIGKAAAGKSGRRGLRKRLDEYRRHGAGEAAPHMGGRFIWQLKDADTLLVGWLPTPGDDPAQVETRMLTEFVDAYGTLPFANRIRGRRL